MKQKLGKLRKLRADALLVKRGLVDSTEKARVVIMAGEVLAAEQLVTAPNSLIYENTDLRIIEGSNYVSRGGIKLKGALDFFNLSVDGLMALDVGASTGGFTDCLLKNGASSVYAVDVGYGQLDYGLRTDPRVISMEKTNIRRLKKLPEMPDIATIDVSFISLEAVLPSIVNLLKPDAQIVALLKPQFESRRDEVKKSSIIRDPLLHATIIGRFVNWAVNNKYNVNGPVKSFPAGASGNIEFFFLLSNYGG